MKFGMRARTAGTLFWLLLFSVYSVAAVGVIVLYGIDDEYNELSKVSLTTVEASEETRNLAAAQMAAVYRARSGAPFTSLPAGATVQIVWPDGSSEYLVVVNPATSGGLRPIPGTQRSADGRKSEADADEDTDAAGTQALERVQADRPAPQTKHRRQ